MIPNDRDSRLRVRIGDASTRATRDGEDARSIWRIACRMSARGAGRTGAANDAAGPRARRCERSPA
jgi:hypothetical protein